jgi:hypothetical protein
MLPSSTVLQVFGPPPRTTNTNGMLSSAQKMCSRLALSLLTINQVKGTYNDTYSISPPHFFSAVISALHLTKMKREWFGCKATVIPLEDLTAEYSTCPPFYVQNQREKT